jgi:hypothetical protein
MRDQRHPERVILPIISGRTRRVRPDAYLDSANVEDTVFSVCILAIHHASSELGLRRQRRTRFRGVTG